jgi:glycosyltransferase involved in cell wall biosynthesis
MPVPLASPATLTVVVPTRDRAPLLDHCLASIRALEGPDLSIELIVVDDGSTDATQPVALGYGAKIIETGGGGSSVARNAGMAAATGEFLVFIDDDDVALPEHVRPHIALMRRRPELSAVVGQVANTSFDLGSSGAFWPATLPDDGDLFLSFFSYYPQCGATVVRTRVRDSVGGQDPKLFGDQDWDWHLRLARLHRIGFVPVHCLLFRQRPPSGGQEMGEWRRLGDHRRTLWRNARAAGWKRMPPWLLAKVALKQRGGYTAAFCDYAKMHAAAGQQRASWRAFSRGVVASPPHAARALLKDAALRKAMLGRLRPAAGPGLRSAASLPEAQRIIDQPSGRAE